MATKVPTAADVAKKWAEVTPGRQSYYEVNAKVAGADWERETAAAVAAFKAAMSAGNIGQMFLGGVKKAGAAKYNRKVEANASRFSSGVQTGKQDYLDGMEPMLATIASVTPPARAPRGSESNLARVRAYSVELNKKRLALRAAGA